ncbi:FAD-binding oxidoreductase [Microtetraspora malaysiensis]|uniref:FAD-binding oxidoreductase n=1 Tax=Microtetraspora malaysiensis TaxID=161358 RepID=UPI00082A0F48|nr:FAD-binding oxidoreductase [Microtetraspora malaysiensis]
MNGATGPGAALAAAGVTIRPAGPDDAVAGVTPRWVAFPETTREIAAVMRVSAAHDLAVVVAGAGTTLHWGRPPERCDMLIDTCRLNEILEHEAGDLVVRVQAGVPVETLAEALAAKRQELALDPPLEGGTVGGLLAAGLAGPRALRYGTARDLLIGITVVLADGTIAKAGGKVVKNVAGYDLGKLFTGSYGTLGVIADATFRLHPLPTARAWVVWPGAAPDEVLAVVPAVTASQAEPSAVELDRPAPDGPCAVAVLVEGAAAAERAQAVRDLLGEKARVADEPPRWWGRLPEPGHPGPGPSSEPGGRPGEGGVLVEIRTVPSRLPGLFAGALARTDAAVRGSLASAVLRVALPAETDPAAAAALVSALRAELADAGRVVVLSAPEPVARRVDTWGHVGGLALMRRIKDRFDPDRRMSPGRFVGGI